MPRYFNTLGDIIIGLVQWTILNCSRPHAQLIRFAILTLSLDVVIRVRSVTIRVIICLLHFRLKCSKLALYVLYFLVIITVAVDLLISYVGLAVQ